MILDDVAPPAACNNGGVVCMADMQASPQGFCRGRAFSGSQCHATYACQSCRACDASVQVNYQLRRAATRAGRAAAPARDVLAEGWREALARGAAGTAVQDSALLAGLARVAAEERRFEPVGGGGSRVADEPPQHQAVSGVLRRDAAAADVLACLVAITRCTTGCWHGTQDDFHY